MTKRNSSTISQSMTEVLDSMINVSSRTVLKSFNPSKFLNHCHEKWNENDQVVTVFQCEKDQIVLNDDSVVVHLHQTHGNSNSELYVIVRNIIGIYTLYDIKLVNEHNKIQWRDMICQLDGMSLYTFFAGDEDFNPGTEDYDYLSNTKSINRTIYNKIHQEIINTIKKLKLKPNLDILEICGGDASLTKKLFQNINPITKCQRYCFNESNPKYLTLAKEACSAYSNIEWKEGNINDQEFDEEEGVFDLIIASGSTLTSEVSIERNIAEQTLEYLSSWIKVGGYIIATGLSTCWFTPQHFEDEFEIKQQFIPLFATDRTDPIHFYVLQKKFDCGNDDTIESN